MKQKQKGYIIIPIILFALILFCGILFLSENKEFEKENILYKAILTTDSQYSEISLTAQKANGYYDEAGYYYEKGNYNLVESNCRLARTSFLDASQGYNEISSMLKNLKIEANLINIKIESYDILSEIQLNLYEACEHFESAVRYYDTYYNTDVPYDDSSYDMGGNAIDEMNEKIRLHDENIRKYNKLLSDFKVELEKRIE